MGIKLLLECDGRGCNKRQEREPQFVKTGGIDEIEYRHNGSLFWKGYLCAECEQKMHTAVMAVMVERSK